MPAKPTTRTWAALVAAASGLTLPVTGLLLHLARYGHEPRIGGGHAFMMVHIILGVAFTVAVILHLVLNRRALVCHWRALLGQPGG